MPVIIADAIEDFWMKYSDELLNLPDEVKGLPDKYNHLWRPTSRCASKMDFVV